MTLTTAGALHQDVTINLSLSSHMQSSISAKLHHPAFIAISRREIKAMIAISSNIPVSALFHRDICTTERVTHS
jgi:hypothetical protein